MNALLLVRHGENPANLTGQFSYRRIDYGLTPKGLLQAGQTAEFLRARPIRAVYSSPLKRALETAAVIARALGLEPEVLEDLRELNVGRLEDGPPTAEAWAVHDEVIRAWQAGELNTRFPGGERLRECRARAGRALGTMLAGRDGEEVVAVAHGGIINVIVEHFCQGVDLERLRAPQYNCAVTELEGRLRGGRPELRLAAWAACAHLSGEAASFVSGVPSAEERDELPG